jgi:hypothetical protein
MWRLIGHEWKTATIYLTQSGGFETKRFECPARVVPADGTTEMLLDLGSNDFGEGYRTAIDYTVDYDAECGAGTLMMACEERRLITGAELCTRSCNTCTCDATLAALPEDGFGWSFSGTTLSLISGDNSASYEVCVEGDGMKLWEKDRPLLTLERVTRAPGSVPCQSRSAARCEAGDGAGDGCHLGACIGDFECPAATTEAECIALDANCGWHPEICGGEAALACNLGDYGKVPGCDLLRTTGRCLGTRMPCSAFEPDVCEAYPGCMDDDDLGCVGEAGTCEELTAEVCESAFGCSLELIE